MSQFPEVLISANKVYISLQHNLGPEIEREREREKRVRIGLKSEEF